jgi:hypothetical protein
MPLPVSPGAPGVAAGIARRGGLGPQLPESATRAVCVIVARLAVWTILGAWRMMTRDA